MIKGFGHNSIGAFTYFTKRFESLVIEEFDMWILKRERSLKGVVGGRGKSKCLGHSEG